MGDIDYYFELVIEEISRESAKFMKIHKKESKKYGRKHYIMGTLASVMAGVTTVLGMVSSLQIPSDPSIEAGTGVEMVKIHLVKYSQIAMTVMSGATSVFSGATTLFKYQAKMEGHEACIDLYEALIETVKMMKLASYGEDEKLQAIKDIKSAYKMARERTTALIGEQDTEIAPPNPDEINLREIVKCGIVVSDDDMMKNVMQESSSEKTSVRDQVDMTIHEYTKKRIENSKKTIIQGLWDNYNQG